MNYDQYMNVVRQVVVVVTIGIIGGGAVVAIGYRSEGYSLMLGISTVGIIAILASMCLLLRTSVQSAEEFTPEADGGNQ